MKNVEEQSAGCASFTPWPFSMQWSSSQHCWRDKICTHHQGKQLFFYGHANVCKSLVSGIFRNEGMLTWELSAGMSSSCLVELSSMVFLKLGPKLHLHRADDSREKKKRKGKKKESKKKNRAEIWKSSCFIMCPNEHHYIVLWLFVYIC